MIAKSGGLRRPLASGLFALCVATAMGCSGGSGSKGHEAVERQVVPLPSRLTAVRFPWFTSDGEAILFSGQPEGSSRVELLAVREDGAAFRCLSCGVAPEVEGPLLKPLPFPDGRRIVLRVGEQNPGRAADHAVLECRPSVAECDDAELVPIVIPPDDPAILRQDQRELKIAPDGRHVGFTQVRATAAGGSLLTAVVGILEREGATYQVRDARVVSDTGELKGFTRDGKSVIVAGFTSPYEAANPDVMTIELATGAETRVTHYPDYDEPVDFSPDGSWFVVGSGRRQGLFETVAQLRRPNFLGEGLEPLVAALFVNERGSLIQPWIVQTDRESADHPGQQLNPDSAAEGYGGRAFPNWHPDGTRVVFWEGTTDPNLPPTTGTRIVVARLTERRPIAAPSDRTSPDPNWAPPLEGFVPVPPPLPASRAGERSGSVEIAESSAAGVQIIDVTYREFSDDGEFVIDGTERAEFTGGLTGRTAYTADLTLGGRHHGFLRADAVITAAGIDGLIESEVDGRRLALPRPGS
jgi:hypothetical protein